MRPRFPLPWLLGAGLLAVAGPARADMDPSTVREHMLPNGMRVLLWEDPTIPNLAIYTFWKVGSRNEAPGITGLAHFFEHMMFNGAQKYGPGEFDRVMEAAGGANNAYTSNDVTVYQDWVPASALETTLDLEADRIAALAVDPQMVESERGVVMSERRRSVEDDNQSLMSEILYSSAYMAHPYSWPVIGWRSDIESWRQEDVEAFFRSWYTPNNAVLVVCGAFDTETLIPRLEATLGRLPAREIPRGVTTREPEQHGERRAILRKEASQGTVMAAWHVPETAHDDVRVLEIIDLILTAGESSRLYRRLVDTDQVALWVAAYVGTNFDPGIYQVIAQNREGVSGDQVEAALYSEIERLKTEPVTAEELAKAKRMVLASFYRNLATISGRAEALGTYALFHGDWQKVFEVAKRYETITPEDIRRVVSAYLTADNRTVVTLIPTAEEVSDAR